MGTLKQAVDRVAAAKTAIGNAITAKGGTVASCDGLEEFAADIATIVTTTGGHEVTVITIADAVVTLAKTGTTYTATADSNGIATFTGVTAGTYTATATMGGVQIKSSSLTVTDFTADLLPIIVTRQVDFTNNTSPVAPSAADLAASSVYSGITRCNVADDGTINAFDGDTEYIEDGTNGQVMVYVPKFWYKLDVSESGSLDGNSIRKGTWSIADASADGFKLHPAFLAADGVTELDYFLYGAFEAVGQDDNGVYNTSYNNESYKLGSVGGNLYAPSNSFTRATARIMAKNRGTGWYQVGVKQTMALQMLFAVEHGFNSQLTVGYGVVNASAASKTGITTGSTTSGTKDNQTTPVNWRGIENFWGNVWARIDGLNINDRVPYFCNTFDFVDDTSTGYTQIAFSIPSSNSYISALGYDFNNDWILLPSEASGANENSAIGDYVYANTGWRVATLGGRWNHSFRAGLFEWLLDDGAFNWSVSVGSRIMYVPTT